MPTSVEDYEKLGAFYLGRGYDLATKEIKEDDLILYDSKDLVTHGVVLGMTGSGKTGLCLSILEEAAMDSIPSIVIDPKGDIANLLLTFPDLQGADFRPWINEEDATKKGKTPDEFADDQAALWEKGLGQWGQDGCRIARFRETVDLAVYTPGSNAGIPVSILSSLKAPAFEVIDDSELFAELIESAVSSLLSLLGENADPIQDPQHILLSNIFAHCWSNGQDLTLELLIGYIQNPPFQKVGVLELEMFYPEKKRFELAMKMNNLLASPGFSVWLQGAPLEIQRMLYTPEGKPRISIFSIAHLSDTERMFFVSLLLNQTLGWMRAQSGTTSLRAMLYMDEIYGYLPPTANPPSKKPLLTMLKQARAFGLGVLLATQNPVDLDYKALSNMGTWFLGRLQTERDKMRVLDGLEGAASSQGGKFDRQAMEQTLAGLGARVFLMNNVNEDAPILFHVRWVMSYLRGPLSRTQIKTLMDPRRAELLGEEPPAKRNPAAVPPPEVAAPTPQPSANKSADGSPSPVQPEVPSGAHTYFAPAFETETKGTRVYTPALLRSAEIRFSDPKLGVDTTVTHTQVYPFDERSGEVDFRHLLTEFPENARPGSVFLRDGEPGALFAELPDEAKRITLYKNAARDLENHLYESAKLELLQSPATGLISKVGEPEGDFRARLTHAMREERDRRVEELRSKYGKRIRDLEDDRRKAEDFLAEQSAQASSATWDTASRIGTSILGAILGRKVGSTRSTKAATAWKERTDVKRAEERLSRIQNELNEITVELQDQIMAIKENLDPITERLEVVEVKPYKKNIATTTTGILWLPNTQTETGLTEAWRS